MIGTGAAEENQDKVGCGRQDAGSPLAGRQFF